MTLICSLKDRKEKKLKTPYGENHKIINGIEFKMCTGCNEWHPMSAEWFYNNKTSPDGFNPYCKEITKKKSKKRMYENYEKHMEYVKLNNQRLEVRKHHKVYTKKYRDTGKQLLWQRENKDKVREYNKNKRVKVHDISDKEWEQCKLYFDNSCAYCGFHIKEHYMIKRGQRVKTDLHREHVDDQGKDNLSNCVPACKKCNSRKNTMRLSDFQLREEIEDWRIDKIITWVEFDHIKFIEEK